MYLKKKKIKKLVLVSLVVLLIGSLLVPAISKADSLEGEMKGVPKPGDVIVTLGKDLTPQQRFAILNEMNVVENDTPIIEVTNAEEKKYLGSYISPAKIGTKAISSSKIVIKEPGYGIRVQTKNIDWITDAMYINALITAGVKDAEVYITAPFPVSGTGALTGIIKAYDNYSGVKIEEANKQVANEEMVKTVELGDKIGEEKAELFMTKAKQMIADNQYDNKDQLAEDLRKLMKDLGIQLDEKTFNDLVDLLYRMSHLNIDWDQFSEQLDKLKENVLNLMDKAKEKQDEANGFFQKLIDFLKELLDKIAAFFGGDKNESDDNGSNNVDNQNQENSSTNSDQNSEGNSASSN